MAEISLCAQLLSGQDASCEAPKRRYFQQAVVINKSDIESYVVNRTDFDDPLPVCEYNVQFILKPGKTGFLFRGSEAGSSYFGTYDKTLTELTGNPQYTHNVNMVVIGASETAKCVLESLDKGRFVVALQFTDGTVEIYGIDNGLSTGDYTYDIQTNGGGSAIILSSSETAPENFLPLVYAPQDGGDAGADFDALFANAGS